MQTNTEEIGFVESVAGKVVRVSGLPTVQVGELLTADDGSKGYVGGVFSDRVEVFLLSEGTISPGQSFKRSGGFLEMPLGDELLGRVINFLGEPLDGKSLSFMAKDKRRTEQSAVGISGRRFITDQFESGITVIDTIFPLGKGQRELLVGEQRSGKSDFIFDVIANQKGRGVICVYTLIGKPTAEARDVWSRLVERGVMEHTVIVMSTSIDPSPAIFLTPQAGLTVAEYFSSQGKDVLIILDDMGTHARNYREMSLVSGRPPGRESYPGDIFYQQARLMERAGSFSKDQGGGTITAIPIIELALSDFAAYIPTNLMGMTDGHFLFRASLAQQGQRPALDLFLSVTRVGAQTQQRLQNHLAMKIKETLARGEELAVVSRFGSELPLATQQILTQKDQIMELLNQKPATFVSTAMQTVLLSLPFTSVLAGKDRAFIKANLDSLTSGILKDPVLVALTNSVFGKKDLADLFASIEQAKAAFVKYLTITEASVKKPSTSDQQEEEEG